MPWTHNGVTHDGGHVRWYDGVRTTRHARRESRYYSWLATDTYECRARASDRESDSADSDEEAVKAAAAAKKAAAEKVEKAAAEKAAAFSTL